MLGDGRQMNSNTLMETAPVSLWSSLDRWNLTASVCFCVCDLCLSNGSYISVLWYYLFGVHIVFACFTRFSYAVDAI